jgi:hypothetical protein
MPFDIRLNYGATVRPYCKLFREVRCLSKHSSAASHRKSVGLLRESESKKTFRVSMCHSRLVSAA